MRPSLQRHAIALAALGLCEASAEAQVYKCDVNGSVVYQQAPCEGGRGKEVDARPNSVDPLAPRRASRERAASGRSYPGSTAYGARPAPSTAPPPAVPAPPTIVASEPNQPAPGPLLLPAPPPRPVPGDPETVQLPTTGNCRFPWHNMLAKNFVVYVVGGASGAPIPGMLDKDGRRVGKFDVDVNSPGRNVGLVLVSQEPALWNIRTTSETQIVGLWATGRHVPLVVGHNDEYRTYRSGTSDSTRCAVDDPSPAAANKHARVAFGQAAGRFYDVSVTKQAEVGVPLQAGQSFKSSGPFYTELVDPTLVMPYLVVLERAEQAGVIRAMTSEDYRVWMTYYRRCTAPEYKSPAELAGKPETFVPRKNSFVVLKPFRLGPGHASEMLGKLYVMPGTQFEIGNRSSVIIEDANQLRCK